MNHDCITVTGLCATGFHGVFDFERQQGQPFVVDLVMWLDIDTSCDNLATTVNYAAVCEAVLEIVAGEPVNLIETLAGRIADRVLGFESVEAVDVTVHKPEAPVSAQVADIAVTIRKRSRTCSSV